MAQQLLDDPLDGGADNTQARSMPAAALADHGPDALAQAAPTVLAAVVACVGECRYRGGLLGLASMVGRAAGSQSTYFRSPPSVRLDDRV